MLEAVIGLPDQLFYNTGIYTYVWIVTNRKRQTTRVRVFEIGRCFAHDAAGQPVDGYHQPVRIAALAAGFAKPEQWGEANRNVDFFDVKADLEALLFPRVAEFERASHPALHPGRSASVKVAA